MSNDLARLMHTLMHPTAESCRQAQWSPAVDIYRTRDGWLVKLDLAGVGREDLQLVASGQKLIVRGRRRDWCVGEMACESAYSMEITYSEFQRAIELPCEVEAMQIATDYRDGMLLVRLSERSAP